MSTVRTPSATAPSGIQPGDILAEKYRVESVLGSGGMGVVVLAEHIELREKVAIKFLLDEAAENSELSERFLREARAAVKIKSEHVVRVLDVGRLPSGSPYMVMEYLEGEDLSQRLERGRVPVEDAVDYVIQSCEAMNVAHRSGIVHRDLKPANLFLTQRPDGSPIIKVLDFGISKVSTAEAVVLSLTHTQAMMGSPLYMSPEQMRSSKDVDRRTDVWSLGVILHELISGELPFSGSAFPEVLLKVMTEPAPSLCALRPEVPKALASIVQRCLAKAPEERFSSVAALAVALAPFASDRTLGLRGRLAQSMSGPAPAILLAPAPPPALGATRVEVAAGVDLPGPLLHPPQAGTLPSIGSIEAALPLGTNTAWEGEPPVVPLHARPRWAWAAAVCGVVAAGLLAFALLRQSSRAPLGTQHEANAARAPQASAAQPDGAPDPLNHTAGTAPGRLVPRAAVASDPPALPSGPPSTREASRSPAGVLRAARAGPKSAAAKLREATSPKARPAPEPSRAAPTPTAPRARAKPLSIEFK